MAGVRIDPWQELDRLIELKDLAEQAAESGESFYRFHDGAVLIARESKLLDPDRLEEVFNTLVAAKRAEERWIDIQRLKGAIPWLRYVAVTDQKTGPIHGAWHGTVLPVDRALWETHYPPNCWGCRCIVQQLSNDDLERYGYKPSPNPPPNWRATQPWRSLLSGSIEQVPIGLDAGFTETTTGLNVAALFFAVSEAVSKGVEWSRVT